MGLTNVPVPLIGLVPTVKILSHARAILATMAAFARGTAFRTRVYSGKSLIHVRAIHAIMEERVS